MASTAVKKKQKMKGKTLNLNEFLADETGTSGPGSSYVLAAKPLSWGEQMDNQDVEGDDMPEYGMSRGPAIDRSKLPSAPRAARGADFDPSRVPTRPPYTAFLGNLQYDICEEDIERFFMKLKLVNIRLPQEQGRMKGFGYAEFEDRESLIDALGLNDTLLNNRKVRIDLAEQNQGGDRDRDRGQWREGDEDRTTGDWRSKPANDSFGGDDRYGGRSGGYDDRGGDRGRFGDRDRYGDRGGDRYGGDRGGDRYGGDRGGDRYGGDRFGGGGGSRYGDSRGGDRYGGDRYGGDRGGDRYGGGGGSRYDDRDSGYGRRQFGTGFHSGGDRDSYRTGGDSYRSGGDRDSYRTGGDSYDRDRMGGGADSEPKERPRLQLKPRTKPVEEAQAAPSQAAPKATSIFGGAKPVDTAAREREIEERLFRERHLSDKPAEPPRGPPRQRTSTGSSDRPHSRRDSGSSAEGSSTSSTRRERVSSSSSSKGIRTVAPPPGAGSARVRSDSTLSDDADAFEDDRRQRSPPKKSSEPAPVIVPAPPPKTNVWEKRKSETKVAPQSSSEQREERKSDDSSSGGGGGGKVSEKEPERQKEEKEQENRETKESLHTTEVAKAPPVNVWEKRQKERQMEHPEIETPASQDGQ